MENEAKISQNVFTAQNGCQKNIVANFPDRNFFAELILASKCGGLKSATTRLILIEDLKLIWSTIYLNSELRLKIGYLFLDAIVNNLKEHLSATKISFCCHDDH